MTEDELRAEVTRLTAENEVLREALNSKLASLSDDLAEAMVKASAELRALRGPPEPESIHCPGTDTDCARDCKTKDCDLMVEQQKLRHGCG